MKKIDLLALILVILGVMVYLRQPPSPQVAKASNPQEKLKANSDTVLNSLNDQLDKFADELSQNMNGVTQGDSNIKGFQGEIPDAYAPKNLAPFTTQEKLRADLNYRLNRFNNDAREEQNTFAKTHDVSGSEQKAYSELLSRQNAQKKEILVRHKEILKEFQQQTDTQSNLR